MMAVADGYEEWMTWPKAKLINQYAGERGNRIAAEKKAQAAREDAIQYVRDALDYRYGGNELAKVTRIFDGAEAEVIECMQSKIDDLVEKVRTRRRLAEDLSDQYAAECAAHDKTKRKLERKSQRVECLRKRLETEQAKNQSGGAVYPTDDEVRAAYKLGVSIKQLRRWQQSGEGPQPPYDDLDAWQSWVNAQ